jgi:hypothetical protein
VLALLVVSLLPLSDARAAPPPKRGFPPLSSPTAERRFREAMRLYEQGLTLQRKGRSEEGRAVLAEAASALRSVIHTDPRAWVYYALGQALRLRDDCEGALEAYRSALERLPDEALGDEAKAEFATRTKQQIGGCVVDHPIARAPEAGGPEGPRAAPTTPAPPPSVPSPSPSPSPSFSPSPSPSVALRPAPRYRYSVAAPVVVGIIGLGAVAAGGAFYAVSGNRYDDLVAMGCGRQIMCLSDRYGSTQQTERASIGLMAART